MATAVLPTTALTERSALELAAAIRSGETSSRAVVDEHIALAERLNPQLNAIVDDRFDAARADADAADARIAAAADDEDLPPLLGVPCTVKESFAVEGLSNTSGLMARRDYRAETTATVPARLIEAGAIPLGVTNLSELTLWVESFNRVYGRTRNAHNPRRTAGGSSGGEGAAIGAGFAPIGLGTDFGGSIRLPAFFNGAFGHKPSGGLVPCTGHYPYPEDRGIDMTCAGPLARRAEDLMPVLKTIAGPDGVAEGIRDVTLGDPADVSIEGLSVAISEGASTLPVSRELRAARERAAEALQAAGARVQRVELRGMRRAMEPFLQAARQSGKLEDILAEDGVDINSLPALLKDALSRRSPHTPALLLTILAERTSDTFPDSIQRRLDAAGRRLEREVAEVIGDGVLLHPPFPRVAPRHGATVGRPWMLTNMSVFNLFGMPSTQVPLGLSARGLPLGVQVVANRDRDHVSIAVAMELERALGGWTPPVRSAGSV